MPIYPTQSDIFTEARNAMVNMRLDIEAMDLPTILLYRSPRIPNFESCNSDSMIVSEQDWCMLYKDHIYRLLRRMF